MTRVALLMFMALSLRADIIAPPTLQNGCSGFITDGRCVTGTEVYFIWEGDQLGLVPHTRMIVGSYLSASPVDRGVIEPTCGLVYWEPCSLPPQPVYPPSAPIAPIVIPTEPPYEPLPTPITSTPEPAEALPLLAILGGLWIWRRKQ